MKKTNYLKLVVNFVPIILLFLLVTYTPEFVKFSHTILGKAFAVILILFYVKLDFILGLFVCALVIFYYQTDYVESFNNMLNEGFTEEMDEEKQESGEQEAEEAEEGKEDKDKSTESTEAFERLEDAYPLTPTSEITYNKNSDNFRKTHCKKGHLIHKGQIVKPEMAEHVFPNVEQSDFNKCNICDPSCNFEINNKRIVDEADLMNPKRSNDMFEKVWTNLRTTTEKMMNL